MQSSVENNNSVNCQFVRSSFNAAAKKYDSFSLLQRTITDRQMESFEHINIRPASILDLGSGTGYGSRQLKKLFNKAHINQVDFSTEMLKVSRQRSPRFFSKNHFLCADASQIPLTNNSVDLVSSSLMLQWCGDIDVVFNEIERVLKPGGIFIFTSFGPDTLKELRECWQQVDDDVHVNPFLDMHDIGDSLMRNGLDSPVLSIEHIVLMYDECKQLMKELKYIGAHNANKGRRKTLTGKQRLQKVISHYESYRHENKLPATYEVIYGHAWKPVKKVGASEAADTQAISFDRLKQELKKYKAGR